MKFNPKDFFKKHPQFEVLCNSLEESEAIAKKKNEERSKNPSEKDKELKRERVPFFGDHAVISAYLVDGSWEDSGLLPKPGKDALLESLAFTLEKISPDAIRVQVFKGKGERGAPKYTRPFYLAENATPDKTAPGEDMQLGALIEKFDQRMKEKGEDLGSFQLELLRKDFQAQLKEQKHEAEIKEVKSALQQKINELENTIREQGHYIDELEEELEDYEGELEGITEKKEGPMPFVELTGRMLAKGLEHFCVENPKLLKSLGATDDDLKKIGQGSAPAAQPGQDNSSFSEVADEYEGLDADHVRAIKDMLNFFKQISREEFSKLYTINYQLQDKESGKLNVKLADTLLALLADNKQK